MENALRNVKSCLNLSQSATAVPTNEVLILRMILDGLNLSQSATAVPTRSI